MPAHAQGLSTQPMHTAPHSCSTQTWWSGTCAADWVQGGCMVYTCCQSNTQHTPMYACSAFVMHTRFSHTRLCSLHHNNRHPLMQSKHSSSYSTWETSPPHPKVLPLYSCCSPMPDSTTCCCWNTDARAICVASHCCGVKHSRILGLHRCVYALQNTYLWGGTCEDGCPHKNSPYKTLA